MDHLWRRIRVLLLIPIVALAMVFDGLSSLMHKAADRLAPTDEKPSDA